MRAGLRLCRPGPSSASERPWELGREADGAWPGARWRIRCRDVPCRTLPGGGPKRHVQGGGRGSPHRSGASMLGSLAARVCAAHREGPVPSGDA